MTRSNDHQAGWVTRRGVTRRGPLLGIAGAAVGALLAACGAPGAGGREAPAGGREGDAGEAIRVGAVIPLTGRYAPFGEHIKQGYELAVEDVNGTGGVAVGGQQRRLELQVLDDESDPTKTVQRLETLDSGSRVAAYLGGAGSDLHAAAAAVAEKNRVPYLGIAFSLLSVHKHGYRYLFSPFPKSPDVAKVSFDLLDSLDPRPARVAIFAETTDWGDELGALWRDEVRGRGYQLVADERYTPGAKDYAPLIGRARDGGAQVVLTLPTGPDGIAMVKQMKELAYTPSTSIILRAPDGATWTQNLGRDGDAVLQVVGWSATGASPGASPGARDLARRYQERHNRAPGSSVGSAYATVQVLADALGRAGSTDRRAIRDALAATDLAATAIGPGGFNPDGSGRVAAVVNQYQDGEQVAVWPRALAARPVAYPAKPFAER